jgi:D-sedoheptulose 7-phosphate isomerase
MSEKKLISNIKGLFEQSVEVKQKILQDEKFFQDIFEISKEVANSLGAGGKILLCGNGGSASDAQHITAEFTIRLRKTVERKGLPAIALAGDSSSMTACCNDYDFSSYYERMVETYGAKGDCLIGFSTSGNSQNIKKALIKAKKLGIKTIGFLGGDGGQCLQYCDFAFVVPSTETARIQESHITAGHALVQTTEDILISENKIEILD